jgi:thioredoxin-related protein
LAHPLSFVFTGMVKMANSRVFGDLRLARIVVVTAAIVVLLSASAEAGEPVRRKDSAIRLIEGLKPGLAAADEADKPVFLLFSAVWCPVCEELKRRILLDTEVQQLADRLVWVDVDIDRNLSLARRWGVAATPTIFLLDPRGTPRGTIVGGATASELAEILRGFLDSVKLAPSDEPEQIAEFRHGDLTWTPSGYRARAICFSHVGYGPLRLGTQSPFQSLRLTIIPRTPSTLGRGQWEARVAGTWANIWANDDNRFFPEEQEYGRYLMDYETLAASLGASYGLSDILQLDVAYDQRWRFGGAMDSFIQSFHDLFGIDQSGRDQVPKNGFAIFLDPMDGRTLVDLEDDAKGSFTRNLQFSVQHNVTCGTQKWPAFSYAVTGRWTIDSEDLEGDDFDIAASVAIARRFGKRWYTYLTLGYAYFGSDSFRGISLSNSQLSMLAAAEWRFAPKMSFIVQLLGSEGVVDDFGPFSDVATEVTLGWKGEIRPAGLLEIGLIENVATFDNSPDFGVHVGYTQRF